MGWAKFFAGAISLLNRFFKNQRDNELRKDGARQVDLALRQKNDDIKKAARKVRRKPASGSKSDILKRL